MMPYKQMNEEDSPTQAWPSTEASTAVNVQPGPNIQNSMSAPQPQGSGVGTQVAQPIFLMQSSGMSLTEGKCKVLVGLAATQLTIGIILFVGNIIATALLLVIIAYVGPGFWCGIMYIIAGSMGIAGAKKKSRGLIITFLVLSIISSVLTVGIITSSGIGLAFSDYNCYYDCASVEASYAFNGIFLVLGIAEGVICIVSAAICCGVICGAPATYVACPVKYVNGTPQVSVGNHSVQPGMAPAVMNNQPLMIVQQPGQLQVMGTSPPPSYSIHPNFK